MMADLPPGARAEVQRVLDRAARRLLADQLDGDSSGTAAGGDGDALDGGADESASLVQGQPIPVRRDRDDDGCTLAA